VIGITGRDLADDFGSPVLLQDVRETFAS
jgi:hypothetical protein